MKIIIAGAGGVGLHLAQLLAKEQQDITLIDVDDEVLEYAQSHVDVFTVKGNCTSDKILKAAGVEKANLLLAVSTHENDNLIACALAKSMGVKQTIARVNNPEYLEPHRRQYFADIGVDKLISPTQLASQEIKRLLELSQATDNFDFEDGEIKLIGITVDDSSTFVGKTIDEIDDTIPNVKFRAIAILRGNETIIPRSGIRIKRNDHVYFLSSKENVKIILKEMGKQFKKVKNVMIIGGGLLTLRTAELIQDLYHITIIEKDKNICKKLVDKLDKVLVVNGDPSNVELLREEGLEEMDAFIALLPNAEINIVTSLMADEIGVYKTIAQVDNIEYTRISQNIGVDTLINKKYIAANNIFRYVRKGHVEAIASLHGVDAEIIEYVVRKEGKITKHNLRQLHFPERALIGSVLRDGKSYIPTGDFQLQVGDKVIVFAKEIAIAEVEDFFS